MNKVTVRDLRNHGGRVLDRVACGETLTVTRSGRAVAELRPIPARGLRAEALLDRWRTATALANGVPAYTCNPDDFSGIHVPYAAEVLT